MQRRFPRVAVVASTIAGMAICLALGACGQPTVIFEAGGRLEDAEAARALLKDSDVSAVSKRAVADAPALRHDALVALRSNGTAAEEAAALITRTFPADTRAVPVRVQTADYDGRPSVVLIEAYGSSSGFLSQKRLWVLERATGNVLLAASER